MKRIITICFALLVSLLLISYTWYKVGWRFYIEKDSLLSFTQQINHCEKLPVGFYSTYDKIHPNHRFDSFEASTLKLIFGSNNNQTLTSPSRFVSYTYFLSHVKSNNRFIQFYLISAIEKHTTIEKCFDYYVLNFDFLNERKGLKMLANKEYGKTMEELTEKEIVEISLLLRNPILYNKDRYPARVQKMVDKIFSQLE